MLQTGVNAFELLWKKSIAGRNSQFVSSTLRPLRSAPSKGERQSQSKQQRSLKERSALKGEIV
jgi:hypothetical protein